eukprot:PhF_6_TR42351/c0_g1_i1/m.63894
MIRSILRQCHKAEIDYYKILKVPFNATQGDIRSAYRARVLETHPDRGGSESDFRLVQTAHAVLSDRHRRVTYDFNRASSHTTILKEIQLNFKAANSANSIRLQETASIKMYLDALHYDGENAQVFLRLGHLLKRNETVLVSALNRTMSKRDCFFEVLRIEPLNTEALQGLVTTMSAGERINVPSVGENLGRVEILHYIASTEPSNVTVLYELSLVMTETDEISLEYRKYSRKELLIHILNLDPSNWDAMYDLAFCLDSNGTVILHDRSMRKREVTKKTLLIEALELNGSFAEAYHALETLLGDDDVVTLKDGRTMTKPDLKSLSTIV